MADRASVARLFRWADRELGRIDILVNCAGVNTCKSGRSTTWPPKSGTGLMAINATGAYNCIREVLPQMKDRRDGLIVNINSTSGVRAGLFGGVAYSASKFAMAALGITVAQEVREMGIRVTNIYPGEVDTPILEHRPVPVTAEHRARILQARRRRRRPGDDRRPAAAGQRLRNRHQADDSAVRLTGAVPLYPVRFVRFEESAVRRGLIGGRRAPQAVVAKRPARAPAKIRVPRLRRFGSAVLFLGADDLLDREEHG